MRRYWFLTVYQVVCLTEILFHSHLIRYFLDLYVVFRGQDFKLVGHPVSLDYRDKLIPVVTWLLCDLALNSFDIQYDLKRLFGFDFNLFRKIILVHQNTIPIQH